MDRRKAIIGKEIEALLNQQVEKEAHSCAYYEAMAYWADQQGFRNTCKHFTMQAAEETDHKNRIVNYILQAGGTPVVARVEAVPGKFGSLKELFEKALDQEIEITEAINGITKACYNRDDYITLRFLGWFHEEQLEEEDNARKALDLFSIDANTSLLMIDWEIAHLRDGSEGGDSSSGQASG